MPTPQEIIDLSPLADKVGYVERSTFSIAGLIGAIFRFTITAAGVIFLLLLLYGGITYMTSLGSEDGSTKAKKIMGNALIGLLIVVMSFGVGTWVLDKLGIGSETRPITFQTPNKSTPDKTNPTDPSTINGGTPTNGKPGEGDDQGDSFTVQFVTQKDKADGPTSRSQDTTLGNTTITLSKLKCSQGKDKKSAGVCESSGSHETVKTDASGQASKSIAKGYYNIEALAKVDQNTFRCRSLSLNVGTESVLALTLKSVGMPTAQARLPDCFGKDSVVPVSEEIQFQAFHLQPARIGGKQYIGTSLPSTLNKDKDIALNVSRDGGSPVLKTNLKKDKKTGKFTVDDGDYPYTINVRDSNGTYSNCSGRHKFKFGSGGVLKVWLISKQYLASNKNLKYACLATYFGQKGLSGDDPPDRNGYLGY